MSLEADAVHRRLDRTIDQLNDQNEQYWAYEHGTLNTAMPQPQSQGYDDHGERKFLTEGGFFPESTPQATDARPQGANQTGRAPGLVTVDDYAVGFHLRSSCFAARTSSSRRTGMVCGALF